MILEARPEHWPMVQPLLAQWEASRHCTMTVNEVLDALASGELTLWGIQRDDRIVAVFATRIRLAEKGNCLEVPLMVGARFAAWAEELHEHCTALAKREHCTRILIIGRKGWAKVAAKSTMPPGYLVVGVVIAKEIV